MGEIIKKAEEKKGGGVTVVVMNMKLHCEGCAEKVKKTLKHFNGVESVKADHKTNKLIVTGKVVPTAIKERLEEKTKKKVELVSPKPPKKDNDGGAAGGAKISQVKLEKKPVDEPKKAEEKKPKELKPLVTTVVLKTRVHCDDCAHKMKKILHKYEGVEEVSVDQAKDQITIKGTMDVKVMLPYLNVKLKRVVEVAPPPPPAKKGSGVVGSEKLPKDGVGVVGDKKGKEDAKPTAAGGGGGGGEKKGKEDAKTTAGGSEKKVDVKSASGGGAEGGGGKLVEETNVSKIVEVVNKMEHNGYPYGHGAYTYSYNPQQTQAAGNGFVSEYWHAPPNYMHAPPYMHDPGMFSDENPNSCSIM